MEGEGREEMVPKTILYLVARILDDGAKVRVKGGRVGGRREKGGDGRGGWKREKLFQWNSLSWINTLHFSFSIHLLALVSWSSHANGLHMCFPFLISGQAF